MRKISKLSLIVACLFCVTSSGLTESYVGGPVSGTWTAANSPYYVVADVDIVAGTSLVIEPNVQIKFTDHFKFMVHGYLTAVGTPGDTIVFTHSLPYADETWAGIRLLESQGTPELGYCKIEWGYAEGETTLPDSKGGGIYVDNTTASIHDCLIHYCKSDDDGAGIFMQQSDAELFSNMIMDNVAYGDGGGVYIKESGTPYLHNNWIEDNDASNGAGVYYSYSNGLCANNDIRHNDAVAYNGGGLLLDHSSPTIQGNRFIANQSTQSSGSGIYMHHFSSPVMRYNDVCLSQYSAIFCGDNSSPEITNNTIFGNGGYALRTYQNSHPFGKNNIAWANNSGFYNSAGCSIVMTFSDIQAGWPGAGNFSLDPALVDPWAENFELEPYSPCIDAGDPTPPYDPDGTIKDVGAHYFDANSQQGVCDIELIPSGTPIQLPPAGGTVWFQLIITNSPDYFNIYDGWYNLTQPDSQVIPIMQRYDMYIGPGGMVSRMLSLTLSASAMPGTYTISAYVGDYPNLVENYDSFTFEKLSGENAVDGSACITFSDGENDIIIGLKQNNTTPQFTELIGAYPNPFNPQTTISFNLGGPERVKLEIFSINGQKIATLIDRDLDAGVYHETFSGAGLASGTYLYTLQAGEFTESGKMTLMK